MTDDRTPPAPGRLRTLGPVALAYTVVTALTGAYFWGDSINYAWGILENKHFWDFGHLFWRPLGWLLAQCFLPLTTYLGAADDRAGILMLLATVCWLSGLGSLLLLRAMMADIGARPWAANVACLALLISQSFLNYLHVGTSYIPGLCLLLLGCRLLLRATGRPETSGRTALWAGVALAAALGFWFPYLWALPAAVLLPFLFGFDRARLRLAVLAALACGLVLIGMNAVALAVQGITTVEGALAWVERSSHGIRGLGGMPRMLFGFARSFIYLGGDGTLYRRYLGKDPLNPVTLPELFRTSLWLVGLFYLFAGGLVVGLWRSGRGRRLLALLAVAAVPTLGFALAWQGGDMERYFPLYPFLFLALAVLLGDERVPRVCKGAAVAFFVVAAIANAPALARAVLERRQEEWVAQASELMDRLRPGSRVIVVLDEVDNLRRDYPLNPLGRRLPTDGVIPFNFNGGAEEWRALTCRRVETIWDRGGDVWVSRRLLCPVPLPEWGWVEDPAAELRWGTLHRFFKEFDVEEPAAPDEGFARVLPTEANRERLARLKPAASPGPLSISRRRP